MTDENKSINETKIVTTKDKTLKKKSFIIDINMIEVPLFQFKNKRKVTTAKSLEVDPNISDEMRYVISTMPEETKNSQVEFLSWTDSKGLDREILAASVFKLPNAFAMDVFHGLLGLYIKKNTPIAYIEDEKVYDMPENKLEFRIHELCDFMRISTGGNMYKKIKNAIRELKSVNYYSLGNGTFYNKKKERYEASREKSISLIGDYDFVQKGKSKVDEMCEVTFGNLVMENIKFNYIKFLNNNIYFQLKSGITRRIYTYLEGNRHNKNYIKREFNTLRYKLPIDFKYPSELKKRLKVPLENLIEERVISDYFYGDEIHINGEKEDTIYFIFKGSKAEVIENLTIKPKKTEAIPKEENELVFPENIRQEILNFKVSESKVDEVISNFNKYQLAEYILWIKDGLAKGKVKDPAAMFVFAVDKGMVKVNVSHPHISEFVEKYRIEVEGKNKVNEEIIQKLYSEYIDEEMLKFKDEEEFMYETMRESLLAELNSKSNKNIKTFKSVLNLQEDEKEKSKMLDLINKWEDFERTQDKSDLFKEQFINNSKLYRNMKDYSQFRNEYISKNN